MTAIYYTPPEIQVYIEWGGAFSPDWDAAIANPPFDAKKNPARMGRAGKERNALAHRPRHAIKQSLPKKGIKTMENDGIFKPRPAAIRCSSLPRIFACPGSLQLAETPQETAPVAAFGTATHAAIAETIAKGLTLEQGLAELRRQCALNGVECDEMPFRNAYFWWKENGAGIADVRVEKAMRKKISPALALTGTCDLLGKIKSNGKAVVIDWKTGYAESNYTRQLQGYALLAGRGAPAVITIVYYARLGYAITTEFSASDLKQFRKDLAKIYKLPLFPPAFNLNSHCTYCPARAHCPAQMAAAQAAKNELQKLDESAGELTPARLLALKPKAETLRKCLDKFDELFRDAVESAGAAGLPDESGKVWKLRPENRVSCDAHAARETLQKWGAYDALPFSASATAIKKAAGKKAADLLAALEKEGFLTTKTQYKLALVEPEPPAAKEPEPQAVPAPENNAQNDAIIKAMNEHEKAQRERNPGSPIWTGD